MGIFTNAPATVDSRNTRKVGFVGSLRVVSVDGGPNAVRAELARYRELGYFASNDREEALRFLTGDESLIPQLGEAAYEQ
jgi:hypothetical protein